MVAAFQEGAPGQVAAMRLQAAANDSGSLMRTAHALAGSAAALGLDQLATAARSLERAVREGCAHNPAAGVDAIGTLAQQALERLAPEESMA
jgi:HPt (histidine-containing phosphotransfer) domain-containing protein